jgi:hypothetical protein
MNKAKGYTPRDAWGNLRIARFGKLEPELVMFLREAEETFAVKPNRSEFVPDKKRPWLTKRMAEDDVKQMEDTLLRQLRFALAKRDGSYFRSLAQAIEDRQYEADANRTWLFFLCFKYEREQPLTKKGMITRRWVQRRFFTTPQLVDMAEKRGWQVSVRRMADVCHALGIRFTQGRPKSRKGLRH